jgi:hypothetical protein
MCQRTPRLFLRLWHDDCAALLSTEWILIATIMVIGLIPALVALREGTIDELVDIAHSLTGLDQSYSFCGHTIGRDVTDPRDRDGLESSPLQDTLNTTRGLDRHDEAWLPADPRHDRRVPMLHQDRIRNLAVTAGSASFQTRRAAEAKREAERKEPTLKSTDPGPINAEQPPCD